MNLTELHQYLSQLSKNDRKTVLQRALKLTEETGELANKALPFGGAYGTNHRVIDTRSILEECADVFLVALSIADALGFDSDDFYAKVLEKAKVWHSLQISEDRALAKGDAMPYEIHITVNAENGIQVSKFKEDCAALRVKPIVLSLQDQSATNVMTDVMTSSTLFGNNGTAVVEMRRIADGLTDMGYNVVREKIEAPWWHPKAPFKDDINPKMPAGCYFECHLNVKCTQDRLAELGTIAKQVDCHLSRNAFKTYQDGSFTIMLTYRSYDKVYEQFDEHLKLIKTTLTSHSYSWEKEIVEFSVFDTKVSHDSRWLTA